MPIENHTTVTTIIKFFISFLSFLYHLIAESCNIVYPVVPQLLQEELFSAKNPIPLPSRNGVQGLLTMPSLRARGLES